ncbi:MAG: hypothetical protein IKK81_07040 [Prevotella sp.]|nr:hypothetical protein [Prevotella sp.]
MKKEEIERLCKQKEQELLGKYFGKLVHEATIERPEDIGDYEKELPLKIEEEYYEFLKDLWGKIDVAGKYSLEDILDKRHLSILMTDDDRESIRYAYDDAKRITLWERVTKTNHKDVTFYKGLLEEYTRELLLCLRCDFIEDIHKLEK